ncbi:hypothetical protein [Clostridium novyi]|uniref:hypothetical protein n=1 Tax=Clostridium novyi TaxID=1542 RepID=UPI0004D7E0F0|nr:hypothetical protein [Clostridium novyi]KEI08004.1 hypothetical protein Z958_p0079 [Clostridium novyi B str. NCTC 9691]
MGLPSYILNFDELCDLLKQYFDKKIDIKTGDLIFETENMERLLKDILDKIQGIDYSDLIDALNALGIKLDALSSNLGISGIQKIYGNMLEIYAKKDGNCIEFKAPKKGKLTSVTYSQSSWRFEDNWDLTINEEQIFKQVRTKEYGECKHFNVFYPINAGDIIRFKFNNISCTSKILWVDFAILEDS